MIVNAKDDGTDILCRSQGKVGSDQTSVPDLGMMRAKYEIVCVMSMLTLPQLSTLLHLPASKHFLLFIAGLVVGQCHRLSIHRSDTCISHLQWIVGLPGLMDK